MAVAKKLAPAKKRAPKKARLGRPPKKKAPSKTGRPRSLENNAKTIRAIETAAKGQSTIAETAALLGVAPNTFKTFLTRCEEARFAWESGAPHGRASLRKRQFKEANRGNVQMLIHLGKQYLGQSDKVDTTEVPHEEAIEDLA